MSAVALIQAAQAAQPAPPPLWLALILAAGYLLWAHGWVLYLLRHRSELSELFPNVQGERTPVSSIMCGAARRLGMGYLLMSGALASLSGGSGPSWIVSAPMLVLTLLHLFWPAQAIALLRWSERQRQALSFGAAVSVHGSHTLLILLATGVVIGLSVVMVVVSALTPR